MIDDDTSDFFRQGVATRDVPRDHHGRYKLPGADGEDKSWTRATTFAATLAETYGLNKWHQHQVVRGFIAQPSLLELAHTIDPGDKKAIGGLVESAHVAAGTKSKADLGTARHAAIASVERTGSWDNVPPDAVADVASYFREIAAAGIQIVPQYVERVGICPDYDVAGTPDNYVYCPWDGKFRVLDKKTGRLDMSECEFAIQLGVYARMRALRNYSTNSYEPVPSNLATDYAIIAHVLVGQGITKLYRVDIEQGWLWCRLAAEVRAARKTKSVITPWITPGANQFGGATQTVPAALPPVDAFQPVPVHPVAVPDFSTPAAPVQVGATVMGDGVIVPGTVPTHHDGGPMVPPVGSVFEGEQADDTSGFFAQGDEGLASTAAAFTPGAPVAGPGTAAPAVDPEVEAAELSKLTKAELTDIAEKLMAVAGVTPDGPGSIKTRQHKPKVAAEIVAFKNARGLQLPAGAVKPAKGKAAVAEAKAADNVVYLNEDAEMRVIGKCLTVQALTALRAEWTNAGRWSDAHEQAAVTRRAALEQPIADAVAAGQPLTPLAQLQGATSLQTLERVWKHVTNGGTNLAPWTDELQAAATAKTVELNGAPS